MISINRLSLNLYGSDWLHARHHYSWGFRVALFQVLPHIFSLFLHSTYTHYYYAGVSFLTLYGAYPDPILDYPFLLGDWLVSAATIRLVPALLLPLLTFGSALGCLLPTQPMNLSNKLYRHIHIKRRHYPQNEAIMQETKALTSPPRA